MFYLLGRGVRYCIREFIKLIRGLSNGVLIQVKTAECVYDATTQTMRILQAANKTDSCLYLLGLRRIMLKWYQVIST